MKLVNEEYQQQVEAVADNLVALADRLAAAGLLVDAGIASMGLQAIKSLWNRLQTETSELVAIPPAGTP